MSTKDPYFDYYVTKSINHPNEKFSLWMATPLGRIRMTIRTKVKKIKTMGGEEVKVNTTVFRINDEKISMLAANLIFISYYDVKGEEP